jgi:hypothetical protein
MQGKDMINYYIFDEIEPEGNGCYWGHIGDRFCEVFPLTSEDNEEELANLGYAKCDASETKTFVVKESDWEFLQKEANA